MSGPGSTVTMAKLAGSLPFAGFQAAATAMKGAPLKVTRCLDFGGLAPLYSKKAEAGTSARAIFGSCGLSERMLNIGARFGSNQEKRIGTRRAPSPSAIIAA